MHNIRPCHLLGELPQTSEGKTAGGYLKSLAHPDYITLHTRQSPRIRFVAEREHSAGHAFFPSTQTDLPDHLFQSALGIREIGSVNVEHLHTTIPTAANHVSAEVLLKNSIFTEVNHFTLQAEAGIVPLTPLRNRRNSYNRIRSCTGSVN